MRRQDERPACLCASCARQHAAAGGQQHALRCNASVDEQGQACARGRGGRCCVGPCYIIMLEKMNTMIASCCKNGMKEYHHAGKCWPMVCAVPLSYPKCGVCLQQYPHNLDRSHHTTKNSRWAFSPRVLFKNRGACRQCVLTVGEPEVGLPRGCIKPNVSNQSPWSIHAQQPRMRAASWHWRTFTTQGPTACGDTPASCF